MITRLLKFLAILIIIEGIGFSFWYRGPKINLQASVNKAIVQEKETIKTIDCGIALAPKLDSPSTYENNPVFSCLGESALDCKNAKGVLKEDLFPTVFEIVKNGNSCDFKLSYPADSILADVAGNQLSGQFISCPLGAIKAVNDAQTAPRFVAPDTANSGKYAGQIYFYGTLGIFMENNFDLNKIQALGCQGGYIESLTANYNFTEKK